MQINILKKKQTALITPSNPDWKFILNLRTIVQKDFKTQGWLSLSTFNSILDWKLRRQRVRTEGHRVGNTQDLIREITGAFWRVRHADADKETGIKLTLLMAMPGIGLGIASAILTLSSPKLHGVIDFRN